jgi:hypothetical protein
VGVREVKDVTGLGAHARMALLAMLRLLKLALPLLYVVRKRPSPGGMSAVDYRGTLPPWYAVTSREAFWTAASAALEEAARDVKGKAERRKRTHRAIIEDSAAFGPADRVRRTERIT